MSIQIDLFNVIPGTIIEVPGSAEGSTRRICASQVWRDHDTEQVCVVPHDYDSGAAHIGNFNDRVSLIGLDANLGNDTDQDVHEINGGELTSTFEGTPVTIVEADAFEPPVVAGTYYERFDQRLTALASGLRAGSPQHTLDGVDDEVMNILVRLGYDGDSVETPFAQRIQTLLSMIGYLSAEHIHALGGAFRDAASWKAAARAGQ